MLSKVVCVYLHAYLASMYQFRPVCVCFKVITLLQFLSSFSKLLQSCVTVSQELIPELDFPKQLLTALVSVLMLDTKGLGQTLILNSS